MNKNICLSHEDIHIFTFHLISKATEFYEAWEMHESRKRQH